jgi:hypothetical protein
MLRFYITVQTIELGAVTLAGISGFIETHIWSSAYTYYLLLVLVVLDVLTNNLLNKKPLVPRNLAFRLAGYTVVLAFAHGFGAHEVGLVWLPQLVLAPFIIVHLRRLIIAFGKLELVDGDVAELLSKKITRVAEREELPAAEPAPASVPEALTPEAVS